MFTSPALVKDYLRTKLVSFEHEVFAALFLDGQNRALAFEPMFRGSVNQASVYPRVVVQRALFHNAPGVILAHSHPSGTTEPSGADRAITKTLQSVLLTIDVRVLDHLVIGQGRPFSFAAHGLESGTNDLGKR